MQRTEVGVAGRQGCSFQGRMALVADAVLIAIYVYAAIHV